MEKRSGRSGGLAIGLVMAVAAALIVVGGLWFFASRQAAPPAYAGSGAARERAVSVYTAPEPVSAPAPEPAAAPTPAEEEPFGFEEILFEEEGLLVARIQGKRYKGFIAIVDDPLRLRVGLFSPNAQGGSGRRLAQMADEYGAVLAVNGGAFADPAGGGSGNVPLGNVIADGRVLRGGLDSTVGMDADGRLYAGEFTSARCQELGLVWALSYGPTLIVDGEICSNLGTYMEEPRTAVGQRDDGSVVLLNIQGRQASALGVTEQELAEIMAGYGCVTAGNMDGGASSDMYYRGKYINICNTSGGPRPIPTCILVMPAEGGERE